MCQKSNRLPTWPQLEHAIKRNFGGLKTKKLDPFKEFEQLIHINRNPDLSDVPAEVSTFSLCILLLKWVLFLVAVCCEP